ncbi:MAG TPA: hypothetical protein VHK70_01870 [Burkholderiaceae bacterium]|nr:hypothetical protein [Burkholderiaceae bacterium]
MPTSDANEEKIRWLIPAWHQAPLPAASSFILLPLVIRKKAVDMFYGDRMRPVPKNVPPAETTLIEVLKGQVLAALNWRQQRRRACASPDGAKRTVSKKAQ